MRPPTLDPTAGERAREIRAYPAAPRRILDPTNPHCGELSVDPGEHAADSQRVFDPTDPECGELHH
jgi:hypothetical protein